MEWKDRGWFLYIETRVERGYEEVTFAIFRNDVLKFERNLENV